MRKKFRGIYLIVILLLINQRIVSQGNNSVNLEFGSMLVYFKISNTTNYCTSSYGNSLSYYSTLTKETQLKSPGFISIKYGVGVSKQMTEIYPNIHLNEIYNFRDFPYDTIRVYDVAAWDFRISVPLIAQFTLSKPVPILSPLMSIPGVRFKLGILNEITVKRINVDNLLYAYKTESGNYVMEHYEEELNKQVSDYYRPMFRKYDMVGLVGIDFYDDYFNHLRAGVSATYCNYLISPIKNK